MSDSIEIIDPGDSTSESPTLKRRRGAQPGNLNALKHGFYRNSSRRRIAAPLTTADLESAPFALAYLRDFIRTTFERNLNSASLSEVSEAVRSLSLAVLAICRLITISNKWFPCGTPAESKMDSNYSNPFLKENKNECKIISQNGICIKNELGQVCDLPQRGSNVLVIPS